MAASTGRCLGRLERRGSGHPRIGILGGENEADRLKNYACWAEIIENELGVPAELYPAADYAGVMQGLDLGQSRGRIV